jgi:cobalamin synthase
MQRKKPPAAQWLAAAAVMALIAAVSLLLAARYLCRWLLCLAGLLFKRIRRPRLAGSSGQA